MLALKEANKQVDPTTNQPPPDVIKGVQTKQMIIKTQMHDQVFLKFGLELDAYEPIIGKIVKEQTDAKNPELMELLKNHNQKMQELQMKIMMGP